jgi:hypothetical protein
MSGLSILFGTPIAEHAGESAQGTHMASLVQHVDQGFDRLQALLLDLRAGDVLYVGDAVRVSGLSEGTCRTALEALARVGLLSRECDGRFVRLTLNALNN